MVSFYLEDTVIELVLKRKLTHINNKKGQLRSLYISDAFSLWPKALKTLIVNFSYFFQD